MSTKPTNETRRQVLHRDGFKCAICGQPIDTGWSGYSIHHRRMRSQGHGYDNLHEPGNLLTLCGSGTTGCHDKFHGGARLKAEWVWRSKVYEEAWWTGELLRVYEPHDPALYEYGYWLITDRDGNEMIREGM